MTILGRELTIEEKAAYFDRMVEEHIKWRNCPIEDLLPADQKKLKANDEAMGRIWSKPIGMSRAEAAGYFTWLMLCKEKIIKTADAVRTSGGFQMKISDNKGMGVLEILIVIAILAVIAAAVMITFI